MKKLALLSLFAFCVVASVFAKPTPTSALSDGFYKADGKYYYVVNEYRAKMKKGSAFSTLIQVAQKGGATPISNADFNSPMTSCEYYPETAPNYTYGEYQECVVTYNRGVALLENLRGKMLLKVEENGVLYYVLSKDSNTHYLPITKKIGTKSLFYHIKQNATVIDRESLETLTKWKNVSSLAN